MRCYGERTKLRSSAKAGAERGAHGGSEEVMDAAAAEQELRVILRQTHLEVQNQGKPKGWSS